MRPTQPLPRTSTKQSQRPSLFNHLPTELVYHVFHLASASSRTSCLAICLVASWARRIALPNLFHTVVIKDDTAYSEFENYLSNPSYVLPNSSVIPTSLVNGVWMEGAEPWQCNRMSSVFEACENITHLALQKEFFYQLVRSSSPLVGLRHGEKRISPRALARNQDLHITVMDARSIDWVLTEHYQVEVGYRSPIFDKVTHLRLAVIDSYKMLIGLACFSRLSHISVPYYLDGFHKARHLQHILELKSLKMLVIAVATDIIREASWKRLEKWVRKTRETDGRVYLVKPSSVYIRDEWEAETRGGESIWDRAVRYTDEWDRSATA
ncbi:hypothetical protein PILCRDRAFT_11653 [Piloderma croceum F 1598]|uniref:F-box domain-containing protein n=1 Tax=Piloderma croceum (strain F 1598) TaxID=765440 RepID=A0A0C3BKY1_PILCF|nr:hypothetical protein PILCRDRAFT_11653 [Piloderma croceum F 1598]